MCKVIELWGFGKSPQLLLQNLKKTFGFDPPENHGYDVVESIKAMHEKNKSFYCHGRKFISATPDTLYTAEALRNCNLTVHISTKLNESFNYGNNALILPVLGRSGWMCKDRTTIVTVENSMGVVHSSKGIYRLFQKIQLVSWCLQAIQCTFPNRFHSMVVF